MAWERIAIFAFGVIFVTALLVLAVVIPNPTPSQYETTRIILALAMAAVAALLPGFIELAIPNFLKAGGALAVFVIVYFYSPAKLVVAELNMVRTVNSVNSMLADGYLDLARVEIEKGLAINPSSDRLNNLLGQYHMKVGDPKSAAKVFDLAAQNAPAERVYKYLYNAGSAHFSALDFTKALLFFNKVAAGHPNDGAALLGVAATQVQLGQFNEGRANFQKIRAIGPSVSKEIGDSVNFQLGIAEILQGLPGFEDRAVSLFREAYCDNADLFKVLTGSGLADSKQYYFAESRAIDTLRKTPIYQSFLSELKSGKRCVGELRRNSGNIV